jgi:hypothetical protein
MRSIVITHHTHWTKDLNSLGIHWDKDHTVSLVRRESREISMSAMEKRIERGTGWEVREGESDEPSHEDRHFASEREREREKLSEAGAMEGYLGSPAPLIHHLRPESTSSSVQWR